MFDAFKDKNPAVIGLFLGVILGSIVMMVAGGLGYTAVAEMSLIMGLCAGPALGWIIGRIMEKKAPADANEQNNSLK